ncbi:hypothetical protein SAMN05216389_11022 [Oceanobacillus limi]|uniref:Uncharacterized protein n=1 Tax=Oceanobacillus limi TaxID=930131 RepID=A0A1I0DZ29_9BACI|nr:hypothetical protein [Oceanobacillus limi]SET38002.1 hypothetical protein SAMN05216389_11022 [Oceanobacillus limi]
MVSYTKIHYFIALVSYPVIILHFIFTGYSEQEVISGIAFFTGMTFIYVVLVYLYSKGKLGRLIVLWGLVLFSTLSIVLIDINS